MQSLGQQAYAGQMEQRLLEENVFNAIQAVLGEMASLSPDEFFHLGGDEVDRLHRLDPATGESVAVSPEGVRVSSWSWSPRPVPAGQAMTHALYVSVEAISDQRRVSPASRPPSTTRTARRAPST